MIRKKNDELLQSLKQLVEIQIRPWWTHRICPVGKSTECVDVFLQIAQRGFSVHFMPVDADLVRRWLYRRAGSSGCGRKAERSHWHGDPFQMQEIDGMLYVRGSQWWQGTAAGNFICNGRPVSGRKVVHCIIRSPHCRRGWGNNVRMHGHWPERNRNQSSAFPGWQLSGQCQWRKGDFAVRFLLNADSDISLHCKRASAYRL